MSKNDFNSFGVLNVRVLFNRDHVGDNFVKRKLCVYCRPHLLKLI